MLRPMVLLILLSSSLSLEQRWSPCGRLSGLWLHAAGTAGFVQVADTPEVVVRVSVADGALYCKCKASAAGFSEPALIKLSIPMLKSRTVAHSEVEVLLSAVCSDNHLECDRFIDNKNSFMRPLSVSSSAVLSLRPQQKGWALSSCGQLANGAVSLELERGNINQHAANILLSIKNLKNWSMCFYNTRFYSLDIHSRLSMPESDQSATLVQEFVLDLSSCTTRTYSEGDKVLLAFSVVPLGPEKDSYEDIHAPAVHDIHDQSQRKFPHLRLKRSANTLFCPEGLHVSLRENAPIGTLVTIVPPCSEGGGVATYTLPSTYTIRPSYLPFTINGSGALTTAGKL